MLAAANDRPWMTALEKQFALLGNARRSAAMGGVIGERDAELVRVLPSAAPFAWAGDTTSAAWIASKSVPLDSVLSMADFPEFHRGCFWWFDQPLPMPLQDDEPGDLEDHDFGFDAVSGLVLHLMNVGNVVRVFYIRESKFGPFASGFSMFPFGVPLGALVDGSAVNLASRYGLRPGRNTEALYRFVFAAMVWLRQRIVVLSSGPIERHLRKQLARDNDVPLPGDVKVVTLRRAESQQDSPCPVGTDPVAWSCRWVVGGHWRNQPYKNERKLIYILPYVKGPADKPLKVPTHTVYSVNR